MHILKQTLRPGYRFARRGVHRLRDAVLQSESVYRKYLQLRSALNFLPPRARHNSPPTAY